ncbi:hypothetical protein CO009_02015 [Candidatus Shapirobacteria bacterium CG_4_8_14_3_um_filter_35_11]|uniref:Chromate transporter n=4 Tax=Candidatus Shapironibacteriota TaxID=1752721 RepID=A0A1J5I3Q7_9BACT|nr:MAG: hypothetical protein AUK05_00405 [Candidatus Shapirobacteria bacterium CG2_30_35_20]PJA51000.1 MAG: hypothetical protein CO168_02120 [Candidatus Shapirobacteria bacterium CG_4_9_14_3_um_filter_36_12]PJC80398.1 MAG: hypothetical protein CO009_02015 [Candidatus Shapirobacteria bacterium CG_4_8_14_3_um_filter_35_11]
MKNQTKPTPDVKTMFSQLESTLDLYFDKKAPAMPDSVKEALVKYGPYLTAILMFMALPIILGLLGFGAMMSPFAYMGGFRYGLGFSFGLLFTIAILIMQGLSLPALFKRQKSGWNLMFYVALLQAVQNLLRFNLGGLIIGSAISFYILFQIKSYYK